MTPLTYTVYQACSQVNLSRSFLYMAIKTGQLRTLKAGRKTLITDEALREWVAGLELTTQQKRASAASVSQVEL